MTVIGARHRTTRRAHRPHLPEKKKLRHMENFFRITAFALHEGTSFVQQFLDPPPPVQAASLPGRYGGERRPRYGPDGHRQDLGVLDPRDPRRLLCFKQNTPGIAALAPRWVPTRPNWPCRFVGAIQRFEGANSFFASGLGRPGGPLRRRAAYPLCRRGARVCDRDARPSRGFPPSTGRLVNFNSLKGYLSWTRRGSHAWTWDSSRRFAEELWAILPKRPAERSAFFPRRWKRPLPISCTTICASPVRIALGLDPEAIRERPGGRHMRYPSDRKQGAVAAFACQGGNRGGCLIFAANQGRNRASGAETSAGEGFSRRHDFTRAGRTHAIAGETAALCRISSRGRFKILGRHRSRASRRGFTSRDHRFM